MSEEKKHIFLTGDYTKAKPQVEKHLASIEDKLKSMYGVIPNTMDVLEEIFRKHFAELPDGTTKRINPVITRQHVQSSAHRIAKQMDDYGKTLNLQSKVEQWVFMNLPGTPNKEIYIKYLLVICKESDVNEYTVTRLIELISQKYGPELQLSDSSLRKVIPVFKNALPL